MMKSLTTLLFILLAQLMVAAYALAWEPVNINKADAETIADSLKGIGQRRAEAIVAWREEHGNFTSADQLTVIKGVGQKTVDKNREYILLE